MNHKTHNPLEKELISYCRSTGDTRRAWKTVLMASLFSVAVFALLPFSALVASVPDKTVDLRQVSVVQLRVAPPKLKKKVPQPIALPERATPQRPKPKLETPKPILRQRLDLSTSLNLPIQLEPDLNTDIGLHRFALTPGIANTLASFTVEELDRIPTPISRVQPIYPARALSRGTEGRVTLTFTVTAKGAVEEIDIVGSYPSPAFAKAAKNAVTQWLFSPGIKDGKPVASRLQITLRFELK